MQEGNHDTLEGGQAMAFTFHAAKGHLNVEDLTRAISGVLRPLARTCLRRAGERGPKAGSYRRLTTPPPSFTYAIRRCDR